MLKLMMDIINMISHTGQKENVPEIKARALQHALLLFNEQLLILIALNKVRIIYVLLCLVLRGFCR